MDEGASITSMFSRMLILTAFLAVFMLPSMMTSSHDRFSGAQNIDISHSSGLHNHLGSQSFAFETADSSEYCPRSYVQETDHGCCHEGHRDLPVKLVLIQSPSRHSSPVALMQSQLQLQVQVRVRGWIPSLTVPHVERRPTEVPLLAGYLGHIQTIILLT